ncbi:hypothetical protein GEMRC1_001294 [Eukaryota sp. GEM-RC1]
MSYVPPFRRETKPENSDSAQQREAWTHTSKTIRGLVNKLTKNNIIQIFQELLETNLLWGKGVLCSSLLQLDYSLSNLLPIYASLISLLNHPFPEIGRLFVERLLFRIRRLINTRPRDVKNSIHLLSHLCSLSVVSSLTLFQIADHLFSKIESSPSGRRLNDYIDLFPPLFLPCGDLVSSHLPNKFNALFDSLRRLYSEGRLDECSGNAVEKLFDANRSKFKHTSTLRFLPQNVLSIIENIEPDPHELFFF